MSKRYAGLGLAVGLVLAGGAVGWAQESPPPTGTEAEAAPAKARPHPQARKQHRPGIDYLGRAVHGDLVVRERDGDFENVIFDRGRVNEATTTTRIVLDRPDGKQVSLELTESTRYKGVGGAAELGKGERATVFSKDGKAVAVLQRTQRD